MYRAFVHDGHMTASVTQAVQFGIMLLEDRGIAGPYLVHICGAYLEQIDPVLINHRDVVFAVWDKPEVAISTTASDVTVRLTPASDVLPTAPVITPGVTIQ